MDSLVHIYSWVYHPDTSMFMDFDLRGEILHKFSRTISEKKVHTRNGSALICSLFCPMWNITSGKLSHQEIHCLCIAPWYENLFFSWSVNYLPNVISDQVMCAYHIGQVARCDVRSGQFFLHIGQVARCDNSLICKKVAWSETNLIALIWLIRSGQITADQGILHPAGDQF